jgi:hypothetical protein
MYTISGVLPKELINDYFYSYVYDFDENISLIKNLEDSAKSVLVDLFDTDTDLWCGQPLFINLNYDQKDNADFFGNLRIAIKFSTEHHCFTFGEPSLIYLIKESLCSGFHSDNHKKAFMAAAAELRKMADEIETWEPVE